MRPEGIVGRTVLLRLDASAATVAGRLRFAASPGSSSSSESEKAKGMFTSQPTRSMRKCERTCSAQSVSQSVSVPSNVMGGGM